MSFKRKEETKPEIKLPHGSRVSQSTSTVWNISTGIPSLDDILGGGIPLTSNVLVLDTNPHAAYGDIVQKYFIAQGIACSHKTYVVSDTAKGADMIRQCMWIPTSQSSTEKETIDSSDPDEGTSERSSIAWRYKNLKKFQTTVDSSSSNEDDFISAFDLRTRIPDSVVKEASSSGRLNVVDPYTDTTIDHVDNIIHTLDELRKERTTEGVIRISIPITSVAEWAEVTATRLLQFLYGLRFVLRSSTNMCVLITLPSYLCSEAWGGNGWIRKLAWMSDGCLGLDSFRGDPYMSATITSHHGFLRIHKLPGINTMIPPSDRFSALRGLHSSKMSAMSGGVGENNIAFKTTRRRLVFETLNLDVEGGTSERRTGPPISQASSKETSEPFADALLQIDEKLSEASIKVAIEDAESQLEQGSSVPVKEKSKKRVGFQSNRPDLYDF